MKSVSKNRKVLALVAALLLSGGASLSASAFSSRDYYDDYGNRYSSMSQDLDCDGVPDRRDRYVRDIHDADCDGVANRYDRHYDRRYDRRYTRYDYGRHHYRWSVGAYLPRDYYGRAYYVDYEPYGLSRPPYGYRWNRVGNDFYLISIRDGRIIRVEYDAYR